MNKIFFLTLVFTLMSCGVKPKETTETIASSHFGIYISKQGKFVVRPSTKRFIPGEDNKITYRIVTDELTTPPADFSFRFNYRMPTMPQMIIPKTKPVVLGPGSVEVVYEIAHGGLWEFEILIHKDNTLVDTLVYTVTIPD